MKKLMVLLTLTFVILFNVTALAADNLEISGGVTYNNLIYSSSEAGQVDRDYWVREELNDGQGYYVEGLYWLGSKFGVGLGLDKKSASWSSVEEYDNGNRTDFSSEYELSSYYGKLAYKVSDNVRLALGISQNQFAENYFENNSWEDTYFDKSIVKGEGLGYLIDTQIDYPITENLSLISTFGYSKSNINLEEVYDWEQNTLVDNTKDEEFETSGLRFGTQLAIKF